MSKKFSHLDDDNNPSMVDISSKLESKRIAKAYAKVILNNEILNLISENKIYIELGKRFFFCRQFASCKHFAALAKVLVADLNLSIGLKLNLGD